MKIVWSQIAKTNLQEIYLYYKEVGGVKVAKSITTKILRKTKLLTSHPEMGQKEKNPVISGKGFRYLVEGNYKIVYKIFYDNDEILIATVFDTRQNPLKLRT